MTMLIEWHFYFDLILVLFAIIATNVISYYMKSAKAG
jgi:hypothetical protein